MNSRSVFLSWWIGLSQAVNKLHLARSLTSQQVFGLPDPSSSSIASQKRRGLQLKRTEIWVGQHVCREKVGKKDHAKLYADDEKAEMSLRMEMCGGEWKLLHECWGDYRCSNLHPAMLAFFQGWSSQKQKFCRGFCYPEARNSQSLGYHWACTWLFFIPHPRDSDFLINCDAEYFVLCFLEGLHFLSTDKQLSWRALFFRSTNRKSISGTLKAINCISKFWTNCFFGWCTESMFLHVFSWTQRFRAASACKSQDVTHQTQKCWAWCEGVKKLLPHMWSKPNNPIGAEWGTVEWKLVLKSDCFFAPVRAEDASFQWSNVIAQSALSPSWFFWWRKLPDSYIGMTLLLAQVLLVSHQTFLPAPIHEAAAALSNFPCPSSEGGQCW